MSKVICNSVGKSDLCNGCGAAKPHYPVCCEPCPVVATAKCVDVVFNDGPVDFVDEINLPNCDHDNYCYLCSGRFKGIDTRKICYRCTMQFKVNRI